MSALPPPAPGCSGCAARDGEIALLRGQVDVLRAEQKELREKIARLERLISRNSGNSSMPPSADDLPGKTPPGRRARGGEGKNRRQGKQPGAPGSHLAWSENPGRAVPLFPRGACACGRDLADAADLGVAASHQVVDVPLAAAEVTQYDEHAAQCGCGRVHQAAAPPEAGAAGTVTYGLNIQAWCVFLMVAHHVPVARCAEIIESLSGARPSDGFVHAMIARAATAVKQANMLIRALIITAAVICADETPIRVGPGPKTRKRYLLVACTNLLTYYFLGDRSMETFDGFVFPDLSGTVVVHDRYVNYDKLPGVIHQLCCSHLLRDLEDAAQSYPSAIWPGQIADALRALIHQANLARGQGHTAVPDADTTEHLRLFRAGVAVGLSQVRRVPGAGKKQPPGRLLLECLRHREHDVLRFLYDLRVPPTSNGAERDLRPAKTQQKISGRLRSETVTRHRYAIRGYISTAAKHGTGILTALRDALAGNPWMPPIPATA
ncbi:MAG: IS66 family transposase [Streptosporangiaceae bacterium]